MTGPAVTLPRHALATLLVVATACVLGHFALGASYAGIPLDGAVGAAMDAYRPHLRALALALGRVTLVGALALALLTSGAPLLRRSPPSVLGSLAWATLAVAAFVGFEAHAHPGLVLPLLTEHAWARALAHAGHVAWPVVLGLSAAGWSRVLLRQSAPARRVALVVAGLVGALGALSLRRASAAPHPAYAAPDALASRAKLGAPPARRALPNVLVLAVDSMRTDKIDAAHTPALARLLGESIAFPHTVVTQPRTGPSWTAMLTSLPPLANGVETMFPEARRTSLATIGMPAHLAGLGYLTAFSSEYAGDFLARVDVGFAATRVPRVELREIFGQGLLARQPVAAGFAGVAYGASAATRGWLGAPLVELLRGSASFPQPDVLADDLDALVAEAERDARPWLGVLFYSQPHFPYTSTAPHYETWAVGGADPALAFGRNVATGPTRTAEDRAQIDALYRGALAETDEAIARLLASLEARGALDDTIVVVTADHGEGLEECPGCSGHGDNLRGMMSIEVPLAIRLPQRRYPDARPARVEAHVSQLDLYPTLLALLGAPKVAIHEGVALLDPHGAPVAPPPDRTLFVETGEWLWPTPAVPTDRLDYPPITGLATEESGRIVVPEAWLPIVRAAKHRVALRWPWKLVYRPERAAIALSLYDAERDPLDEHDVAAAHPDVVVALADALRRSVLRYPHMLETAGYFLTRPSAPREEYY